MPGSGYARRLGADQDLVVDDLIAAQIFDQDAAASVVGEDVLFGPCPPWPTWRATTSYGPEGFDSGIPAGWAATGGTVAASGAQAYSGVSSALVTVVGTPTQAILRGPAVPVVQGQLARVQAQVYAPAGAASMQVAIDWYLNGIYQSTSVTGPVALVAATWTALDLSVTVPAGCNSAQYGPTLGGSPSAGTQLFVDQVTLSLTTILSAVLIPYGWLSPPAMFRADQPINDITITPAAGAAAVYTNSTSVDRYGSQGLTIALDSIGDDAGALATWYGTYYGDFRMRQPAVSINLFGWTNKADIWRVLGVGVGDRIWIPDAPTTWPAGANLLMVEGVEHAGPSTGQWLVTWSTSPVIGPTPGMSGPWFELDDTEVDSTSVAVPF